MEDVFIRELVVFVGILLIFAASVPMLIRGHVTKPIESTFDSGISYSSEDSASEGEAPAPRLNKKRKARLRDAAKKQARRKI